MGQRASNVPSFAAVGIETAAMKVIAATAKGGQLVRCGAERVPESRRIVAASKDVMKGFKMSKKLFLLGVAVMMLAIGTSAPAAAGQPNFELFGGYYYSNQDGIDNDYTYGLRFGGRVTEMWGWQVSGSVFDLNNDGNRAFDGFAGSAKAYLVDSSLQWFPGGGNFAVFGGIGFASVDIDLEGTTDDLTDDALTFNFGVSYLFQVTEAFYIRPDLRMRDYSGDNYDSLDTEASVGFGWNF
jgi:hypothetical protein